MQRLNRSVKSEANGLGENSMNIGSVVIAAIIGLVLPFVSGSAAEAAEVKVLSGFGMRAVMEDLGPKFQRASGHKLALTFGNMGGVVKRVQGGETADVVIIPRQGINRLVKEGKVVAGNVTVIARSVISIAVRKGSPKPDISSPEALKRTLLAARSITYGDPAQGSANGRHFALVLDRLGIANEMKSKTVFPTTRGRSVEAALVANGEADIVVAQFQNLMFVEGIEVVGPLPNDLQWDEAFAAAVVESTGDAAASTALVKFLQTLEAASVIKANGLEPVTP